jgi:hypothetical protein
MGAGETGNAEIHRELESRAAFPRDAGADAGDAASGSGSDKVEIVETHLSRLYFVGAHVFKVKKAVDLGFVDFSTLEQRKFACDEEVRLNRRLAPDTYLGVRPIVRGPGGAVRVGGAGAPIEYAVEMVRLPAAQMLDAKLARGEIDRLRRSHRRAARRLPHARRTRPRSISSPHPRPSPEASSRTSPGRARRRLALAAARAFPRRGVHLLHRRRTNAVRAAHR